MIRSFDRARFELIASPQESLQAAAAVALRQNITPIVLSDRIEGEARRGGAGSCRDRTSAARGRISRGQLLISPPAVLLSGGETTVTVTGKGRGGRNVEFLLALAVALDGADGISALACDTDGIDGTEDNAGAIVYPDSIRASRGPRHLGTQAALADNDGYGFFAALGDLVVTGPTLTNVNDFRAILVARLKSPAGASRCGASAAQRSSRPSALRVRPSIRSAALFEAGVDVFRLNFSHGTHGEHLARFEAIRQVEHETGRPIGILADLQGPKLRLGTFAEGPIELTAGARFRLDLDRRPGDQTPRTVAASGDLRGAAAGH